MNLDNEYWSSRYIENSTGWDAGIITTPLKEYIDQLVDKDIAILIPGCGNSYEAGYLLQQGFTNITVIDISTFLCKKLEIKFEALPSSRLSIICADFFDHAGEYDLVIEQTFFCAIDPSLRNRYSEKIYQLLKPGGKLVGLFFNRVFAAGPPFGGTEIEYRQLFQQRFTIATMENCYNSIVSRKDTELFVRLIK